MKKGFDNDKYLQMQSEHIRERIAQFDNKLYLEFGGKLFDDYHASRVLPGFQPDSKLQMLLQLKDAGVPKIEIERTVDPSTSAPRVTVNIYCAKPGMVIGKGGEERVALQNKLTKEYGKTVIVNVIEVKSAATNAQLVAEDIARQLENRVTFRRAMKQCMRNAMSPRDRATVPAKGIKAMCSGRLGGADIARVESYHEGTIPLQTLRADIDYGFAEAATTYGRIGVKVWVYKGEVLKSAKNAQKKEGGNK